MFLTPFWQLQIHNIYKQKIKQNRINNLNKYVSQSHTDKKLTSCSKTTDRDNQTIDGPDISFSNGPDILSCEHRSIVIHVDHINDQLRSSRQSSLRSFIVQRRHQQVIALVLLIVNAWCNSRSRDRAWLNCHITSQRINVEPETKYSQGIDSWMMMMITVKQLQSVLPPSHFISLCLKLQTPAGKSILVLGTSHG